MIKTIEAVFDGETFRPAEPIQLAPNTRVKIVIETLLGESEKIGSFLQTAQSLKLDGPADWSENLDEYLYDKEPASDE
ncbi:MAG: antitoxin family protein [Chloroflexota bacterium]